MVDYIFGIARRYVEIDKLVAADLHLVVDASGNNVARSERAHLVIAVHKFVAVLQPQHTAEAAHGLRDQERRPLARVVKRRGVELNELHILRRPFGTVNHRYAIARRNRRIGRGGIDVAHAARRHNGESGTKGLYLLRGQVQHIRPEAHYLLAVLGHYLAQVVLGE